MNLIINPDFLRKAIYKSFEILDEKGELGDKRELADFTGNLIEGSSIIGEIEDRLDKYYNGSAVKYSEWCCGISYEPYERKKRHTNTKYPELSDFKPYFCENEIRCRFVERYFVMDERKQEKMQGGESGGKLSKPPIYLYIFKCNS